MPGPSLKHGSPRRANRKKFNWGPFAATAATAVVVFGFLIFLMSRSPAATASASGAVPGTTTSANDRLASEPATNRRASEPTTNRDASQPTTPARNVATAAGATTTGATQQPAGAVKRETQPAVPATVYVAAKSAVGPTAPQTAADRAKLVQVQIASGEFGPALQTARSATEAVERTDLLKTIADAQLVNGDLHAADLSISRMPIPESRDEAWRGPRIPRVSRRRAAPLRPPSS